MTKNQEISFSSGLLISVFVSGLVYFFLFIATFDLFGLEEIRDPESRHAKFFYTGLAISVLKGTVNNWQGEEYIQYGKEYWYCVLGLTLEDGKVNTAGLWVDD
jgi:hypothetical protein